MPPITVHSASVRPSEFIHWTLNIKTTYLALNKITEDKHRTFLFPQETH